MLDGRDVTGDRPWRRAELGISRTFQANRLNLDLPVRDDLLSGAYTTTPGNLAEAIFRAARARAGMREATDSARAVAELLNIAHYWDEPARVLSHGNRRRERSAAAS